MIKRGRADHFDTANFSVFDEKRLCHQNTRRAIEARELERTAIRENTGVDGALVEYDVGPDHSALSVDQRVAAVMNGLDDEVETELELRHAVERETVDGVLRLIGRTRNIGGVGTVLDAVAIIRKRICSGAIDALAV